MGPSATWLTTRAVLRRTWRTAVVLALMIGVVGGVVAATLRGANRIAGSYESLLAEVDAPDAFTGAECYPDDPRDCPSQITAFVELLRADPAVADAGSIAVLFPDLRTSEGTILGPFPEQECATGVGELELVSSDWHRTGRPFARTVSGRFPDPAAVDEVALPTATAERAGVGVGDTVFLEGWCHGDLPTPAEPVPLTVVGIFVGILDVRPPGTGEFFESVIGSPALSARLGESDQSEVPVWFRAGKSRFDVGLENLRWFIDVAEQATSIEDSLGADVTGLRLFAAASALAALAVLGQLLAGVVRGAVAETLPLHALGARPRDRWAVGMMCGVTLGIGAALVAAVTAAAAVSFVPTGAADAILRGSDGPVSFSTVVVAALATIAAVVVVSVVPAWLAARSVARPSRPPTPGVGNRIARALRLGPCPSLGMRFALEPAGVTRPVPLRTGLGAMVVATAAVAAVVTFAAGLEHLRSTPRLVGWNWDLFIFLEQDNRDEVPRIIATRPDVVRSSTGAIFSPGLSFSPEESDGVRLIGFDAGPGAVSPNVLRGRAPQGPDEALLAPGLADQLGLDIGSIATVYARNTLGDVLGELEVSGDGLDVAPMLTLSFEVVGIGVVFVPDGLLDQGMTITLDGMNRAFPPPSRELVMQVAALADPMVLWAHVMESVPPTLGVQLAILGPEGTLDLLEAFSDAEFAPLLPDYVGPQVVFIDLRSGTNVRDFVANLVSAGLVSEQVLRDFQSIDWAESRSTDLVNLDLDDAAWIPAVFGQLMALTTLAVLVHVVVTGTRARRRDLAVLRALGLNSPQVRRTVAWQAMTLTIVTLAIAVPTGVVAGRFAWHRYAEGLDVVPEPVTPWPWLIALIATMIVVTLLVSVLPARRAIRRRPIESLRSE